MTIDFHAHILPRCDHGCNNSAMSHDQLRLIQSCGTNAVVATPHFYPNEDSIDSFLDGRDGAIDAMRRKLPLEELPTVYAGAEVLVCEGLHKMKGLERLAIEGTNVILLEMPIGRWSDLLMDTVLGVRDRGLTPVLAHIDRYDIHGVMELLNKGILAQVNADAFGLFKNAKPYVELMREGKVVALGSDLHKVKRDRYRHFVRVKRKLGTLADKVFARTAELLKTATPIAAPNTAKKTQTV